MHGKDTLSVSAGRKLDARLSHGQVRVKILLLTTVSRPVCPGITPPYGTRNGFFLSNLNYLQTVVGFLLLGALIDERVDPQFTVPAASRQSSLSRAVISFGAARELYTKGW
jgi:hypothetical protein